jgi:outer membrane protein OmpA-like peptidoglycan-associated protein
MTLIAAAIAAALPAVAAQAQSYSDEQLLQMFDAQRQAFRDAATSGTGQTRGLSLLTIEDVAVQAGTSVNDLAAAPATNSGSVTVGSVTEPAAPSAPAVNQSAVPVTYARIDEPMQVNLNIQFGFDSAALADDQLPVLQQMCTVMQRSDINLFRIVGHTDAAGSDTYNERLSALRAAEVARWLVSDCGIDSGRLETMGLGKRFLKNPGNPRGDENRRVEFQALS